MSLNTFIFMGRPGAGKGTQSALLSQEAGIKIFSTGDKVREIAKTDTALGKKIKEISEQGGLTPAWFASYLFQQALFSKNDGEGMIFEGVGRKEPEARLFAEISEWMGEDYRVIHLDVSEEEVTTRLIKRGESALRADDKPEKIRVRLEHFEKETRPALEYFRSIGKVIDINGSPSPEEVFQEVKAALNNL